MTTINCGTSGQPRESGFTLVETIVSLALLATGLLSVAAVFGSGMKMIGGSSGDLVLVQKATEAIESVFTARDTKVVTWSQIRNIVGDGQSSGGIFKDGAQPIKDPGADGMVNTADDGTVEVARLPGRDNLLNTSDDEFITLSDYTREIEIRDISASLRRIRVIVRYYPGGTGSGAAVQEFILVTYISTYA
jgi:hypothetical protein